jgi:hypothetical protein
MKTIKFLLLVTVIFSLTAIAYSQNANEGKGNLFSYNSTVTGDNVSNITKLNFESTLPGVITVKIYEMNGKEVKTLMNDYKEAGKYTVNLNKNELPSGDYFYIIKTESFSKVISYLSSK